MTRKTGHRIKVLRVVVQCAFLVLFFYLLIRSGNPNAPAWQFTNFFFITDPLLLLANLIATGKIFVLFLFALIPLFLTFVFGRFFCGWICPFGSLNHFFSWVFLRKKKPPPPRRQLLKLKYFILVAILASAVMGTHLVGWLDPFSLFTRTTAGVIDPGANYTLEHTLKKGATGEGIAGKVLEKPYQIARDGLIRQEAKHSSQAVLMGLILLAVILLNLHSHRFYCNHLCPLGALYGLAARFSLLGMSMNDTCTECKICSRPCTYYGGIYEFYQKSECMVCFNCIEDCPPDSIEVRFQPPRKEKRTQLDISRRQFSGSLVTGLFLGVIARKSAFTKQNIHPFVRPPGSVAEEDFLRKCIRCGQCIQICPTNFIQPALFETGVDGIWTPVLNARLGYCDFECKKCLEICPTDAIQDMPLEEKKTFKVGTAVIDRDRCYTYADGYNCAVCEEHCPVPDKAIKYRRVKVWNFEGKLVEVDQIYVVPDLCIGCGNCEHVCPRSDVPAIVLGAEEEQREFSFF